MPLGSLMTENLDRKNYAKNNQFILAVDWKPEVLHLKYDYSDDIVYL